MRRIIFILLYIIICFTSCEHKENYTPAYYTTSSITDGTKDKIISDAESDEIIIVPFTEKGGVKYIDVELNGTFTIKMILDSGCSSTSISVAEAELLYNKGVLTDDDIIEEKRESRIADGSIVEDMVINIREVVIGGKISCKNVEATVSSNSRAPLLLGNEVLNRAASYTIDNTNKTIIFKLNSL